VVSTLRVGSGSDWLDDDDEDGRGDRGSIWVWSDSTAVVSSASASPGLAEGCGRCDCAENSQS
jgi:hypothetical protein